MTAGGKARILYLVLGFTLWGAAFLTLYAVQAVGCAAGWDGVQIAGTSALRLVLIALFLVFSLLAFGLVKWIEARRARTPRGRRVRIFLTRTGYLAAAAALGATLLVFAPVFFASACI